MFAIVAPGQGSQKPGMLAPWLSPSDPETVDAAVSDRIAGLLEELCDAAELDLRYFGTEAGPEEIVDTAVAQPLIVAFSLLGLAALDSAELEPRDTVFVGHSVGELAALAGSGVLTAYDAVALARARGVAMARCCQSTDGSMAALLGVDSEQAEEIAARAGLRVANHNGGGQVVVGGPRDRIVALASDPPPDVKVVAMSVAGAFHTELMADAREEFAAAVGKVEFADPHTFVLSSTDGEVRSSGFAETVVSAVTSPVRWDHCVQTLRKLGADHRVELPPAGTLSSMARRETPRPTLTKIVDPASAVNVGTNR
ncbi:ACP S-malonyltransferase [Rhodococcus sp. 1168]|uniref:ACP S-malonyltransferase n=1 Tax=Rhodococcus sp. 1168 TaxID=2018041 RepID=UPI000F74172F|nr:ACP S-malonyltransferase [Rhodococcus sp. 1168]